MDASLGRGERYDALVCSRAECCEHIGSGHDDKAGLHVSRNVHAGGRKHWKGQATAARKSETAKKRSKPVPGRNRSQAWATALLKALPQPFQDLAARWGFAACHKQHSPSLSPVSGSGRDTDISHYHQVSFPDWASRSSGQRAPELRLNLDLSSSSFHNMDKGSSRQMATKPIHRAAGGSGAKKGRSGSMDVQSDAKRSAFSGGEYKAWYVFLEDVPLHLAVGIVSLC